MEFKKNASFRHEIGNRQAVLVTLIGGVTKTTWSMLEYHVIMIEIYCILTWRLQWVDWVREHCRWVGRQLWAVEPASCTVDTGHHHSSLRYCLLHHTHQSDLYNTHRIISVQYYLFNSMTFSPFCYISFVSFNKMSACIYLPTLRDIFPRRFASTGSRQYP